MPSPPESIVAFPEEAPLRESLLPRRHTLETRSGRHFDVRAARSVDLPALRLFLSRITPEDLRYRFLSPVKKVPDGLLQQLLGYDHVHAEHFLAFEQNGAAIIASAIVAANRKSETAEIAICTRPDYKDLGLSWALLEYVSRWASRHGFCELIALEAIDHGDALQLEREQGFRVDPDRSSPGLICMTKRLHPSDRKH
ncbi:GNAT family N-acetyltransferase [Sphingomonas sp. ID1715]|uniref:GNAT family N-acetyltransferase n=1 Tax=Sphingomonas sp. ID1715 TaxID=1656898 RepID=UPI0014896295|nr:GNAT family N-acetyltransferase [Sphingomonas sp. ID1715]NNM76460.1 GNAT family N-acetyltransferase [Sphingomonas sp. ID1715]